ncbi:hypothetical protein B0H19DRAFT_1276657 [Mycena capillaripes]|nr:hypothetical protein B0H19DRAFT_1276657 [Mycena capillaripes]
MATDPVTIIIDDTFFNQHTVTQGTVRLPVYWRIAEWDGLHNWFPSGYNDTLVVYSPPPLGEGAWALQLEALLVLGTSASYYGVTPPSLFNQTIGISSPAFDGGKTDITQISSYTPYTYPAPARGGLIYSTDVLPNSTQFQLGLNGFRGLALDYVVVTVGELTSLQGQRILVDDTSTEITWAGTGWTEQNNFTLPIPCSLPSGQFVGANDTTMSDFTADVAPHGNTTHATSTPGDSFTFRFAGTSISVSGITPGSPSTDNWIVRMDFTLDGNTNSTTFTSGLSSDPVKPHFTYFSANTLSPGNHTLVVNVTELSGTPLPTMAIDYLTYQPSFQIARDKPDFSVSSDTTTTGAGENPSSLASRMPVPKRKIDVGSIVGGVVGGIIFLVVCSSLGVWLLKRKRRKDQAARKDFMTEPFLSQSSQPSTPRKIDPDLARRQQLPQNSQERMQMRSEGDGSDGSQLESHILRLQSQMDVLTREVRAGQVPPMYEETS